MIDYAVPTQRDIYEVGSDEYALDVRIVGTLGGRNALYALIAVDGALTASRELVETFETVSVERVHVRGSRSRLTRLISELSVPAGV